MSDFPIVNSKAVTVAPIQTALQAIFVPGTYLKMSANNTAVPAKETTKLIVLSTTSDMGRNPPKNLPSAAKAEVITNETRRRNPTAKTMPKEKKRCWIVSQTPPPLPILTSHILLSADRSSPKTPEAPNTKVITPMMDANVPDAGSWACSIIPFTASDPWWPIMLSTWPSSWAWAVECPKINATMAITRITNGASDRIV